MATVQRLPRVTSCAYIYNHEITILPTSLFSVNFNRNHVKNHPKPWTCPLNYLKYLVIQDKIFISAHWAWASCCNLISTLETKTEQQQRNSTTTSTKFRRINLNLPMLKLTTKIAGVDFSVLNLKDQHQRGS